MPNYGFGGYQYETSPRKLEPEYEPQKESYAKKKTTVKNKNLKKVLFVATGALFSPTFIYQKQNILSIAHAITMEVVKWVI